MATTDVASQPGRTPNGTPKAGGGRAPVAPVAPAGPTGVARVTQFYQDVLAEMKRVTWPARKELQDATVRIIIFVLFLGALIALMDIALQFVLVRLPQILLGGGAGR
ncbi:MAG TPA: preprotein translocase subunit SecE [Trebonia sp.]